MVWERGQTTPQIKHVASRLAEKADGAAVPLVREEVVWFGFRHVGLGEVKNDCKLDMGRTGSRYLGVSVRQGEWKGEAFGSLGAER